MQEKIELLSRIAVQHAGTPMYIACAYVLSWHTYYVIIFNLQRCIVLIYNLVIYSITNAKEFQTLSLNAS